MAQADVASALNIKQPSVSKTEKQVDMYISTLRSYVEAIGGELELTVQLPKRQTLRLQHLGATSPPKDGHTTRAETTKAARFGRRHGGAGGSRG
jgi:hypothetical protein